MSKKVWIKEETLNRFDVNIRGNLTYIGESGELVEFTSVDLERLEVFSRWAKTKDYLIWLRQRSGND